MKVGDIVRYTRAKKWVGVVVKIDTYNSPTINAPRPRAWVAPFNVFKGGFTGRSFPFMIDKLEVISEARGPCNV